MINQPRCSGRPGPYAAVGVAIACFVAACGAACAARQARVSHAAAPSVVSYDKVHEIFRESCEHCHNADKAKGGLLMGNYESLIAGGDSGSPIVAGQSAASRLVQMLEGAITPRMPYKEDPLPAAQVELIRRWIDAGAPGPAVSLPNGPGPAGTSAAPGAEIIVPDVRPTVRVVGAVTAIAFDGASRRIAVGGYQTVHLMSLVDRRWTATLNGHADLVRSAAFSPDGKLLAAAGGPAGRFGEIKIWNIEAAAPRLVSTLRGHADAIQSIAFSPDAATLASASYDKLVKLWDIATAKETRTLKEHSDAVYTVLFTADGRHVVSGAGDRTIKVWDAESGQRLVTISDSLDAVYAIAVHPSGGYIAAAGADKIIRTWAWAPPGRGEKPRGAPGGAEASAPPAATPALRASTFAHGEAVLRLTYSSDGSTLVSAGADRAIKVWDAESLRERAILEPQPDWVMGLALSGDGKWLAAGRYDGTFGLYDLANGRSGEQFVVPR